MNDNAKPRMSVEPNARLVIIGISVIIIDTFLWAASDTAAQYLTQTLPPLQITFLRYLFHFALLLPLFRHGLRSALKTEHLILQILRGIFAAISGLLFIVGLNVIPVADATAITFISPILLMAGSALVLKEYVGIRRWLAAIVGLIGVMIIVQPGSDAFDWAAAFPAGAALSAAVAIMITRMMPHENPMVTMIYTGGVGLVFCALATLGQWHPPSLQDIGVAFIVGLFSALANYAQIWAFRIIPASILAPFFYTQLIWASVLGFIVFGVWPTTATLIGALVIVASGTYSAYRERVDASPVGKDDVSSRA